MIMSILEAKFSPFAQKTGADFGSGLGRLVFPMASVCDHVYGIDISPAMRAESAVQANARGLKNVEFVPALPDGVTVDWINSYIVFQHILPRTGYELLRGLLSRLVIGGHVRSSSRLRTTGEAGRTFIATSMSGASMVKR